MPLVQKQLEFIKRKSYIFLDDENDCMPKVNQEQLKSAKKCLFGPSNPEDTHKLLEEQLKDEQKRFAERFDIDVQHLENVIVRERSLMKMRRKKRISEGIEFNRVLKPYNKQIKLTELYQLRKKFQSTETEKEKS